MEPRPDIAEKLRMARPRDININAGCGASTSEMQLTICGGLSSCSEDAIRELKPKYADLQSIRIPIITLRELLNKHLPPSAIIDFCKIDVEGLEGDVLSGIDFTNHRPKIFCIESTVPLTDIPNHQQWEYLLTENGYILSYVYGINRYYVDTKAEDCNELLRNFVNIAYRELDIKIVDMYHNSLIARLRKQKILNKLMHNNMVRRLCGKKPL